MEDKAQENMVFSQLLQEHLVEPIKRRFQEQRKYAEELKSLCDKMSAMIEQKSAEISDLKQKLAAANDCISRETKYRKDIVSAFEKVNWKE